MIKKMWNSDDIVQKLAAFMIDALYKKENIGRDLEHETIPEILEVIIKL